MNAHTGRHTARFLLCFMIAGIMFTGTGCSVHVIRRHNQCGVMTVSLMAAQETTMTLQMDGVCKITQSSRPLLDAKGSVDAFGSAVSWVCRSVTQIVGMLRPF